MTTTACEPAASLSQPVSTITLTWDELQQGEIKAKEQPHARVRVRVSDTVAPGGKRRHVYVVEASATRHGPWRHVDPHGSESEVIDFKLHGKQDWVMTIVAIEVQNSDVSGKVEVRKSKLTIPPSTEVGED